MNLVKTCRNALLCSSACPLISAQAGSVLGAGPDLALIVKAVQEARAAAC